MKTIACCIATTIVLLAATVNADPIPFTEDWESGVLPITKGWTFEVIPLGDAPSNWGYIDAGVVGFIFGPQTYSYSDSLISPALGAAGYVNVSLSYDVFLDNFSIATLEQLSVDVYDGSIWQNVANYDNQSVAPVTVYHWPTQTYDISSYAASAGDNLKLRFRAHGADSFNINAWGIDNIAVTGTLVPVPGAVVLAVLGLGTAARKLRRRRS